MSISNELEKMIKNIDTDFDIHFINADFEAPDNDTPYLEIYLMGGVTDDLAIDNPNCTIENAILQVTLKYPTGKGAVPIEDKAREIIDLFPNGSAIVDGSRKAIIKKTPYFSMVGTTDDRFIGAVTISFKVVAN